MNSEPSIKYYPEHSFPYSVHIALKLGSNVELHVDSDIIIPFAQLYTLKISARPSTPRETANYIKRVSINLDAFASAREAENVGKNLTIAILWFAISKGVTVAFEKWAGIYPFTVRDRTQSMGDIAQAEGRGYFKIDPREFISIAEAAIEKEREVAPNILMSMSFLASARMETTEQARFIGIMTALEALSEQVDYGEEVGNLLVELASQLEANPLLAGTEKSQLRSSLSSRMKQLRQESVRQAILRIVRQHISDQETIKWVDQAYGIRSKILHEGLIVPELHLVTNRLEGIVRHILASMFNLPLAVPVNLS
jgi:hypothetical protein